MHTPKGPDVMDIVSECGKQCFNLIGNLLVEVKMAVFDQQSRILGPQGTCNKAFGLNFWSPAEQAGQQLVDVQATETSQCDVYTLMEVGFDVLMGIIPARTYVLKLDNRFIWLVKLESQFTEELDLMLSYQGIQGVTNLLHIYHGKDGNDVPVTDCMAEFSLHIYLYILFAQGDVEVQIEVLR